MNKIADRKSQVSGMTYDGLGRVTQRGFGATVAAPTTYDLHQDHRLHLGQG